jgi:hypothetical protein
MTYENRKKLEELSLNAFGGKNKYLKLYKRGYPTEMTRTKEDGTEEKYKGDKYQTMEEIVVTMHEMIAKKEQEEAEKLAKSLEKQEVKALVPGTEQTMDELRREGSYE